MNGKFINELLIDPLSGEELVYNKTSNTLRSSVSGNSYNLVESVPRIIIEDNKDIARSDLHAEYNSDFKYGDHYQKDAELFDYSEQSIPGITRNEFCRLRESVIREISNDLSTVLDIGCGNGWVSKKLIPLGKRVISMDISSNNPVNAIKQVQHNNHAGLIADVYNIPLKNDSIDCIIASEIMEHVADPKTFLINLVKLLRQNGKLIITTPYNEKIEFNLCVHCNKPTPKSAHLHSFTEESIKSFIPQKGITVSSKRLINRYLSLIRSHIIMRFIPFTFWMYIDNFFNWAFNNPTRLQIVIIKAENNQS